MRVIKALLWRRVLVIYRLENTPALDMVCVGCRGAVYLGASQRSSHECFLQIALSRIVQQVRHSTLQYRWLAIIQQDTTTFETWYQQKGYAAHWTAKSEFSDTYQTAQPSNDMLLEVRNHARCCNKIVHTPHQFKKATLLGHDLLFVVSFLAS